METLKTLILTIIVLTLVNKCLSFYDTVVFTGPLLNKKIIVPFI